MSNAAVEKCLQEIIRLMEAGTIPWRKTWFTRKWGVARNGATNRRYTGINTILLSLNDFTDPRWVTFKQVKDLGGHVKKGEHGTPIVFAKQVKKEEESEETERKSWYSFLRYYHVFNVEQTEGCDLLPLPLPETRPNTPIEEAEGIVAGMPNPPSILHQGDQPCYSPGKDRVLIPPIERFEDSEEYHSTLFHELVHSTGHATRLNRPGVMARNAFGSEDYGKEELVAELGAVFLCARCGIEQPILPNSTAYLQGWLKTLKQSPSLLVSAASLAQKAVDYITGAKATEAAAEEA